MKISASQNMTTGFKVFDLDFDRLKKLVALDNWHYSNIIWNNGYRKGDNYLPESDCLIFDYDSIVSIEWALRIFKNFKKLICTTKNHQKEKNGVICDRFRLILPCEKIDLNKDDFVALMKYLTYRFNSDMQATDAARKYLSSLNCEIIITDGSLFSWKQFYSMATKKRDQRKKYFAEKMKLYSSKENNILNSENWLNAFKPHLISQGNRNSELARIALWLRDAGGDHDLVLNALEFVNSRLSSPINERELLHIVNSKFRG